MYSFQKILGMLLMMFFVFSNSLAQIAPEDEKTVAAIRNDIEVLSKKIEDGFNKNPKVRDEMRNKLQELNAITDAIKLQKAADSYRSAFLSVYGDIVKTAGIDMNDVVKQLNAKYTDYTFAVQNSYGISYKKKPLPGTTKTTLAPSSPTTTTTAVTGFIQAKETSCLLASGSSVTFPSKGLMASSVAAVAGLCSAKGELKNEITLPTSAVSVFLRLTAKQKISGWAVGVVGTSITHTEADIKVFADNKFVINEYESESAIAPLLWIANYDYEFPLDKTIDLTAYKGKNLRFNFKGFSSALSGACCATVSTSEITYSRADLIVTK